MNLNEWVKNYIKEVTHSHEYEDMSQMGEDENDPQEIKVGNYQTKYFHVCPGASALYKDIESKGVDMDMAERSARLQDALYFVEEHIQRDGYKPERDYVMVANNLAKNIMKLASMMNLTDEHSYIQGHVDTIESIVKHKGLEERIMELTEENVPTDPAKWSYYKSQAKEKFDVYPSAYANAWAAKQYKDAGGGWRKSESVNEEIDGLKNAKDLLKYPHTIEDIEYRKTSRGDKFVKIIYKKKYVPGKMMDTGPHFVSVFYTDEKDLQNIGKALKLKLKESVKEATPEEEDEFHRKLDKLVHKTFGHSSDEKKMNEAYVVMYAKKKGEKPAAAAYRDKDMALKFEKDLKKDGYITMMVNKKIKGVDESVNEANGTYFKAAYEAAEYAKEMAEKKGYQIDGDDWQTQIGFGGKYGRLRPGVGKTHSFSIGLTKNGKPQRKALNISLYGMDRGYELTYYIN